MIFSEEYDAALWYILKADKKNRKKLVDFIKGLPSELVSDIKKTIEEMKEYSKNGKKCERIYKNMECGDIVYHYSLDPFFGLDITKAKKDGKIEKELFDLSLLPVNVNNIKLLDNFEEEWIGNIAYNFRNYMGDNRISSFECDEREYAIIKTPIGYCSAYRLELFDGEITFPIFNLINLDSLPGDVTMESIDKMSLRLFRK